MTGLYTLAYTSRDVLSSSWDNQTFAASLRPLPLCRENGSVRSGIHVYVVLHGMKKRRTVPPGRHADSAAHPRRPHDSGWKSSIGCMYPVARCARLKRCGSNGFLERDMLARDMATSCASSALRVDSLHSDRQNYEADCPHGRSRHPRPSALARHAQALAYGERPNDC